MIMIFLTQKKVEDEVKYTEIKLDTTRSNRVDVGINTEPSSLKKVNYKRYSNNKH